MGRFVVAEKLRVISNALVFAVFSGVACAQDITVFAASSMKLALDEIAETYAPDVTVHISYAGSSVLARQITYGAPADIFISANSQWMNEVVRSQDSDDRSVMPIASNTLVLIAHADVNATLNEATITHDSEVFNDLADARLAMGFVSAVPVGLYGKAALEYLHQWGAVSDRVVQTDNARAVLALVALGEVPYGIAYGTDALAESRVQQLAEFPRNSHPRIEYLATQVDGAAPEASAFLNHLSTDAAQAIFKAHGFVPLSAHE